MQYCPSFRHGVIALALGCVFWLLVFRSHYWPTFALVSDHSGAGNFTEPSPSAPRISIILVWKGPARPYLNGFFTSFHANSESVELIWIHIRENSTDQCADFSQWTGPSSESNNIKVICLSNTEYWALHGDYFCQWWKCEEDESDLVLRTMLDRAKDDNNHSNFRLWRGYVFKRFIHPHIQWWGWADPDTFMGNFQSQFPWDLTEYDVIIPAPYGNPLLYMRGHLGFIRAGPATEMKMNLFENLSSMSLYIDKFRPAFPAEEAELSAFIIRNTSIKFIIVPRLLTDISLHLIKPNTPRLSTLHGVYTLWNPEGDLPTPFPDFPMLSTPTRSLFFSSTFSTDGITYPVEIFSGNYSYGVWFPKEFTTHCNFDKPLPAPRWRRFVGRGGGFEGGSQGVWVRMEPPLRPVQVHAASDPSIKVDLVEGLYIHNFNEKSSPWFKSLPQEPLTPSQTLVTFWKYGAEIWDHDTGQVIWRT